MTVHSGDTLTDTISGNTVTFLRTTQETGGEFLAVEWRMRPGTGSPYHWHPKLKEVFTVKSGTLSCLVDGRSKTLHAGESITFTPRIKHQFLNNGDQDLVFLEEVTPAGHHEKLFEWSVNLANRGLTDEKGMSKNPLLLGLSWYFLDGYLVGIPWFVQATILGSLAWLARRLGYEQKYLNRL